MNQNKGSEFRLYYFTENNTKYLQIEIYVSLKGTAKMGQKKEPKQQKLMQKDGTKAFVADYEDYVQSRND